MSGEGRPQPAGRSRTAPGLRLGVAAASWHADIVDALLERALATAGKAGSSGRRWSGCRARWSCRWSARSWPATHDAVVALGVVIRGGTPHFEYVCDAVTAGLTRVALDERTPVGNGVLTCDTLEQARATGPAARARPRTRAPRPAWPRCGPRWCCASCGATDERRGHADAAGVVVRAAAADADRGLGRRGAAGRAVRGDRGLLRNADTGVYFRLADQVSMVLLGLFIAGGLLLLARPAGAGRRRAASRCATSLITRHLPWAEVRAGRVPGRRVLGPAGPARRRVPAGAGHPGRGRPARRGRDHQAARPARRRPLGTPAPERRIAP